MKIRVLLAVLGAREISLYFGRSGQLLYLVVACVCGCLANCSILQVHYYVFLLPVSVGVPTTEAQVNPTHKGSVLNKAVKGGSGVQGMLKGCLRVLKKGHLVCFGICS